MQNEYPYQAEALDGDAGDGGGGALPDAPSGDAGGAGESSTPSTAPPPGASIHDTLTAAFDAAEKADTPPPDAPGTPPGRDARGRFAPGAPGQPPREPAQAAPPAQAPAAPLGLKPPPSWKAEARAEWAKLTPAVQQEVYRRESEVGRALQETSQARGMVQEFSGILAPYAHNISASGIPATTMIQQLFEADNGLRHSTPLRKAQIVANIINSYGIDVQTLDGVLANVAPVDDPQQRLLDQLRSEIRREMQPVTGFMQTVEQRQRQIAENARGEVAQEITAISHLEHFDELRPDMADILERAAAHDVAMTMEEAYKRALRLHPTLYESAAREQDQQRAQRSREAAQRARAAAISRPSGAPAGHGAPVGAAGNSVRDSLMAAWDAHGE